MLCHPFIAIVISLCFAKTGAAADIPKALVRFVNVNPAPAPLDLRLDEELLFSRVPYRRATAYREIPIDRRAFSIRSAGSLRDRGASPSKADLWNGHRYTVVAMAGPEGRPLLRAFHDDLAGPATGRARLRFLHADSHSGPLTVLVPKYKADPADLGTVEFSRGTPYLELNPITKAIELHSSSPPPIRLDALNLQPDRIYTFIVSRPDSGASPTVTRIEDRLAGPGVEVSRLPQYRPVLFPGTSSRTALQLLPPSQEGFGMLEVVSWIIFGLIVGVLAKLLVPGRDPGGIIVTILLGIAGAILGGWVGRLMGIYGPGQVGGWIMSILGAVVLLLLYRAVRRRPTRTV